MEMDKAGQYFPSLKASRLICSYTTFRDCYHNVPLLQHCMSHASHCNKARRSKKTDNLYNPYPYPIHVF